MNASEIAGCRDISATGLSVSLGLGVSFRGRREEYSGGGGGSGSRRGCGCADDAIDGRGNSGSELFGICYCEGVRRHCRRRETLNSDVIRICRHGFG